MPFDKTILYNIWNVLIQPYTLYVITKRFFSHFSIFYQKNANEFKHLPMILKFMLFSDCLFLHLHVCQQGNTDSFISFCIFDRLA